MKVEGRGRAERRGINATDNDGICWSIAVVVKEKTATWGDFLLVDKLFDLEK